MDFPLPLTLVLMLEEDRARALAARERGEHGEHLTQAPGDVPRSSGVFSTLLGPAPVVATRHRVA